MALKRFENVVVDLESIAAMWTYVEMDSLYYRLCFDSGKEIDIDKESYEAILEAFGQQ